MNAVLLLAGRELRTYFNTTWGWIVLASVLLFDGLFFNVFGLTENARYSAEVLEDFFFYTSGTVMIGGLFLTMRFIAEERQTGTLVLLESAPLSATQIVAGKFLGAWGFMLIILACTTYMPALIFINGKVSVAQVAVGYLGVALSAGTTIAIGTFASALARNQLLAVVLGGAFTLMILICWFLARFTEAPLSDILAYSAIWDKHFQPFMRGRLNTENIVYFFSVSFAFLLAATRAMQARRWQ
jgi:ABC-2 type transport system permease protein